MHQNTLLEPQKVNKIFQTCSQKN